MLKVLKPRQSKLAAIFVLYHLVCVCVHSFRYIDSFIHIIYIYCRIDLCVILRANVNVSVSMCMCVFISEGEIYRTPFFFVFIYLSRFSVVVCFGRTDRPRHCPFITRPVQYSPVNIR